MQKGRILCDIKSEYNRIIVEDRDNIRYLHFSKSDQSALNLKYPPSMVFPYTSYLHLALVLQPKAKNILNIGLGGGIITNKFLHDYNFIENFDVLELDPQVLKVAKEFFGLTSDKRLHVYIGDGRAYCEEYLTRYKEQKLPLYDAMIIDAYSSNTIPFALTTVEFLKTLKKILTPNGLVACNIIGYFYGTNSLPIRAIVKSYASVFEQIYLFPVDGLCPPEGEDKQNIVLIASKNKTRLTEAEWRERASEFCATGAGREPLSDHATSLLSENIFSIKHWTENAPSLTDDYAPDVIRKIQVEI